MAEDLIKSDSPSHMSPTEYYLNGETEDYYQDMLDTFMRGNRSVVPGSPRADTAHSQIPYGYTAEEIFLQRKVELCHAIINVEYHRRHELNGLLTSQSYHTWFP